MCMYCRSLFVLLSFLFWPLCCTKVWSQWPQSYMWHSVISFYKIRGTFEKSWLLSSRCKNDLNFFYSLHISLNRKISRVKIPQVCVRWIPQLLTCEQKQNRVDRAKYPVTLGKILKLWSKEDKWNRHWRRDVNQIRRGTIKYWSGKTAWDHKLRVAVGLFKRIMYLVFFDAKGSVAKIPINKTC